MTLQQRLDRALEMLNELAEECAECVGTGVTYKYHGGQRYPIECQACHDIRRVIAVCSAVPQSEERSEKA